MVAVEAGEGEERALTKTPVPLVPGTCLRPGKLLPLWVLYMGFRALVQVVSARLWPDASLGSVLAVLSDTSRARRGARTCP